MPKRTQPHRECKKTLRTSHEHIVYINIIVKETQRKLCRVDVSEDTSIRWLKESIIDKNKKVMMKNLFINDNQCRSRIIKVFSQSRTESGSLRYKEILNGPNKKLKNLGFRNGLCYKLTVRFVRALGILTRAKHQHLVDRINRACQGKYP